MRGASIGVREGNYTSAPGGTKPFKGFGDLLTHGSFPSAPVKGMVSMQPTHATTQLPESHYPPSLTLASPAQLIELTKTASVFSARKPNALLHQFVSGTLDSESNVHLLSLEAARSLFQDHGQLQLRIFTGS
jgi:hypothetical protein